MSPGKWTKLISTILEKQYLNDFIKRRPGLNAIISSIKNIQAYLLYEAYVEMEVLILNWAIFRTMWTTQTS